jgi:hypothetical protein
VTDVRIDTSFRLPVVDAPAVTWRAIPEAAVAHAFRDSGPGWMTSVCRAERFSFRCSMVAEDFARCRDCDLLANGAPGEITEAYGR